MPRGQSSGHRALAHLLAAHSIATPKQAKEPISTTLQRTEKMTDEEKIDMLFREVYKQVALNHKDFCTNKWGHENFHKYQDYTDKLVDFGLIQYTDNEKLRICVTEKGERVGKESSYLALIKEEESQNQNEKIKEEVRVELDKVNLVLAKRQLRTFWLMFLIAFLSLLISLIALFR